MNIYGNCLLIVAICVSNGFSDISAAENNSDKQGSKLKASAPGRWVPSKTFVKKNTMCYREYLCKPKDVARFGRNVKVEGTKLQRRKSICAGRNCQCKTAPPTLVCEVNYFKRR